MSDPGKYDVGKMSDIRVMIAEACEQSKYYNHIYGLVEVDVTKGREFIRKHEEKTGEKLSFTAWVMKCIAQAVSEFKILQTFRKGRYGRKTITFHDVDVKCMIEKEVNGEKTAIAYIIRKANEKSYLDIHNEIRTAQSHDKDQRKKEQKIKRQQKLLLKLPRFIRQFFWRRIMNHPVLIKKHLGTIGLTSMGMFGKQLKGWTLPKTAHSTTFALNSISKEEVINDDNEKEIREILKLTIIVNHDVVDGAPAVRFAARLNELLKNGFGLPE